MNTEIRIEKIAQMKKDGMRDTEIAKIEGVTPKAIYEFRSYHNKVILLLKHLKRHHQKQRKKK